MPPVGPRIRRRDAGEGSHRPFVAWAIVLTLLLGAGWGAHLLFEIGIAGTFEAAPAAKVVAHGMAQLWGFVALFIAGVSIRHLPIATGRPAPRPGTRRVILGAIVLGVVASYLWSLRPALWPWLGPVSGALLAFAAAGHALFLLRQLSGRRDPLAFLVGPSGLWLVAWAGATLLLTLRDPSAGPGALSHAERLVLMDLPLFGLALGSVYGFGQRLLPGFLGGRGPRRGGLVATAWLHNGGLAVLLLGRALVEPTLVTLGLGSLFGGAIAFVTALPGLLGRRPAPRPERGPPVLRLTIRTAFAWLVASLGAMGVLAALEQAAGDTLPHVYHGAARHAFTVGFLVTAMLGVGQRLLPLLDHTLLARPGTATPILVLLSAGNLIRVATEVATEHTPLAYAVMPFSSLLEVAAIVLFSVSAFGTMRRSHGAARGPAAGDLERAGRPRPAVAATP